ncbi:MAG: hypothetical protein C0501_22865 [Isosphaera sp.]|nr:hypothetical protein [Isosphaera sp.]
MTRPTPTDDPLPPACRATADRLNRVLDGEWEAASLDADRHPAGCAACRERVAAARLVLSVLAQPEPVAAPPGLTDRIVSAVRADRRAQARRRVLAFAGGLAAAAAVALAAWLGRPADAPQPRAPDVAAGVPPAVAPEPRAVPVRIGEGLSKFGQALRDTPIGIADASAAPRVLATLTDALTRRLDPAEEPTGTTLADLPDAARAGLEPVTGTAQKAFARLLRDVGGVSPKPKS